MLRLLLSIAALFLYVQVSSAVEVVRIHKGTGDVAVIFIHGIPGNPEDTFTHSNGTRWFDLLKSENAIGGSERDGESFHIYSIDYTDAFESNVSIEEIATQVTVRRDFLSLFRDHNHLFFVAHSTGGLVIKRSLVLLQQRQQNFFLNRVVGAAFLGVPSEGTALADLADQTGVLGNAAVNWLGADWRQIADLRTIESGNTFLLQLQGDWGELAEARRRGGFPFFVPCAYETRPEISLGGMEVLTVVERMYASTTCSGRIMPLNVTHTMLVKPEKRSSQVHDWLMVQIARALQDLASADIVTRPSWMDLGDLLDAIEQEVNYVDQATGLPGTDVVIELESGPVQELQLKEKEYSAPTYAELLRRIGKDHDCLAVAIDGRRRVVRLSLSDFRFCNPQDRDKVACDIEQCE